jgi:hypothetical protein
VLNSAGLISLAEQTPNAQDQDMDDREKRIMPLWAKVTLVLVAIFLLLVGVVITLGIALYKAQEASPENIQRTLQDVGDVQYPLPEGFSVIALQNYLSAHSIHILHKPQPMRIILVCLKGSSNSSYDESFRQSFETNFEKGLAASGVTGFVETSRQTLQIGQKPFTVRIGHCNTKGQEVPILRAREAFNTKLIILLAAGSPGQEFDLELFKKFASSIKRIE